MQGLAILGAMVLVVLVIIGGVVAARRIAASLEKPQIKKESRK